MKIFIDGEPFYPLSPTESRSKQQLLKEIDEEIVQNGLTYTTITVDGVEMDSSAFLHLRKGREAHFKTCKIKDLVIESLQEAINYLPRLTDGIQKIASEFERKEEENADEHMTNFAEGLGWLINVMQKNQILLKVKDSELPNKEETIVKINASLESISECFEKRRIMEIAFHMRQGILPEIKNISGYVAQLLDTAMLMQ
ncbi:MAG: hypothetical protein FWF87_02970 [Synergistaceae bacterium]|nr:hypothetical protein [Synergistaceae bacterium]